MSEERSPYLVAVAAAGVALLCCAAPVLFSAGIVTALAGIGLANLAVILLGGGLLTAGSLRLWRRHRRPEGGGC